MKRKLIQLAGKTLVVSIPSKWAASRNLRKGQEIDIEERSTELVIRSSAEPLYERVSVDLSGFNERVIAWILSALHKAGYDEIEAFYDSSRVLEKIQETQRNLMIGFIIVEQSGKRCVLKSVSRDSPEEFDVALRRNFLVAVQLAEGFSELIRKKEFSYLPNLLGLEQTNNQLSNFCGRVLNKFRHFDERKSHFLYLVASSLERICDDYKYMCNELLADNKGVFSADFLKLAERLALYLRSYYNLFYSYTSGRLVELGEEKNALLNLARKNILSDRKREVLLSCFAIGVLMKISELSATIVALNTLFSSDSPLAGSNRR